MLLALSAISLTWPLGCAGTVAPNAQEQAGPSIGDEQVAGPTDVQMVPSAYDYASTVSRLERGFHERGIETVIAFDPAEHVHARSVSGRSMTLFIVRLDADGTLIDSSPIRALDLAQRVLVYTGEGSEVFVVWRPPSTTPDTHDASDHEFVRQLDRVLEELAAEATGAAPTAAH